MICGRCARENPDGAKFCAYCGERFAPPKVQPEEKSTRAERRRAAEGPVGATGRVERPPERKPPIPTVSMGERAARTIVPKRARRDDLFFEDVDAPGEDPLYENEEGERARRVKSAAAAVCLLVVLGVLFWFLALPGGQITQASLGMNAPAYAYAALGERYLTGGNPAASADAYYEALRREPESFDYALAVGKTQALAGNRDKALAAYAKCISLRPGASEPYQAVSDLYLQMGDEARALNALKAGYDNSGNLDLFRAYQTLSGAEDQA